MAGCFLVFLLVLLVSRAVASEQVALPAWPPPPQPPYIVYEHELTGPKEIGAKLPFFTRLINSITGESSDSLKLDRPFGLSLDDAGNLLVTDTGANAVCFLDFQHKKWTRWTAVGKTRFVSPVAAVHAGKFFYVADSALAKVIAFDIKGKIKFEITNGLERPSGIALMGDKLIIADSQQHQVFICSIDGKLISRFGKRGRGPGEFNFPTHVAVDAREQIFVTDSLNRRIQVFTNTGQFVREFGSAGDGPGHFSRPKGVAVDRAGHVYVVDAEFGNVQIFNDAGRLLFDWGETGTEIGKFWLPNAIAINSGNEIFIADAYNHRIQVFRYTGKQ